LFCSQKRELNMRLPLVQQEPSNIMVLTSSFAPVRMLEIEIERPLPDVSAFDEKTGQYYKRAHCLVRLHTHPLGVVELQFNEDGVSSHDCAQYIWSALQTEIIAHLQQDGLPSVTELDSAGLSSLESPQCIEERNRFLANAPFVSVIVSTRDRPEQLQRCLRSLVSLRYSQYEIIVVDNAPGTNATAEFIQQTYHDMPRVRYVREDRPGLARARNRGIKVARGKILAFTDDDVVVDSYWLVELVRAFSAADDVVCVTGLILPLELETQAQFWFEEYGGFSKGFTRQSFDMKNHHPRTPLHPYTAGKFGTGASMAFTTAFLRSIGGFDPTLGVGSPTQSGEDFAAFFQAVMQGHKLVYEPASLLYHLHRRDYAGLRKQIYHNSIGLTAYLIKIVLDNPWLLFNFVTKLPYGLFFTLSSKSPKNSKKSTHYPNDLTWVELKGMLYGPLAYAQSRWATHDTHKVFASVEECIALPVEKEIR
jgi:GT2 family glycosyltransferase